MWLISATAHYTFFMQKERQEAEMHQVEFNQSEANTAWLSDTFENHQSEYAQLFFQTLLVIALGNYLMKKQEADIREAVRKELKK